MRCDAALEILLEADPGRLRADDHAAADHVARCSECRRAVDHILHGERLLDGWLGAAPRPDTRAIVAAAEVTSERRPDQAGGTTAGADGPPERSAGPTFDGPPRTRPGVRAAAWLALAAAAVAAILLVGDTDRRSDTTFDGARASEPGAGPSTSPRVALRGDAAPHPPATPEIDVPTGRNAAILRTDNPDITVIWFYGGD